jgi:hypothetical protein
VDNRNRLALSAAMFGIDDFRQLMTELDHETSRSRPDHGPRRYFVVVTATR